MPVWNERTASTPCLLDPALRSKVPGYPIPQDGTESSSKSLLQDAPDPALRGTDRGDVRARQDRRGLPPLHRGRGRGCGRRGRVAARRLRLLCLPRSPPPPCPGVRPPTWPGPAPSKDPPAVPRGG